MTASRRTFLRSRHARQSSLAGQRGARRPARGPLGPGRPATPGHTATPPHFQGLRRAGTIVAVSGAKGPNGGETIVRTGGVRVIQATRDDLCGRTQWARDAVWRAACADGLRTRTIIHQLLAMDRPRWIPGMGWDMDVVRGHPPHICNPGSQHEPLAIAPPTPSPSCLS